ncbi:Uncharacterised protein [uncultured archaeon]|nr:Uncharacterised protein [uncultured archaeon]
MPRYPLTLFHRKRLFIHGGVEVHAHERGFSLEIVAVQSEHIHTPTANTRKNFNDWLANSCVEGENRLYTVLSLAGGLFCLSVSIFLGSPIAAAIGAIFFCAAIALWKYGYVIVPYFMKGAKIVEAGRNYEIPPSQDVIVGKGGGNFLATAFLAARLYESASERQGAEKAALGEMFEKAIASSGFPFKICALVSPLEMKGELEEIQSKRSIAESRREKLSSSRKDSEIARLDREIAMWNRQIERLTSGEKPLEMVFYLSTTASGLTKEEAISRAHSQASELSVVVGSALSCEIVPLKGEEMKRCFWWDFFGPADRDDLQDQMF